MPKILNVPEIGEFILDGDSWDRVVYFDAWKCYLETPEPGRCSIQIQVGDDSPDGKPESPQLAAAIEFWKNHARYAELSSQFLMQHLRGESDFETALLYNAFSDELKFVLEHESITTHEPDLLAKQLTTPVIAFVRGDHNPSSGNILLEIVLDVWWEEDRSIGILFDNDAIVGVDFAFEGEPLV